MDSGFLFPGQGSQYVGMGNDFFNEFSCAKEIYQEASDILEFDLAKISFEGPEDELRQTRITQPAIFTNSYLVFKLIIDFGIEPGVVAGHSLGEYSALVACGAISFTDGLRVVKLRGELMQNADEMEPGTMAAIIGLSPEQVDKICKEASQMGVVVPANYNSPEQIVISGSIAGVKKAMELAQDSGAKRVLELMVSAAFHSPLMSPTTQGMTNALQELQINKPDCPIVPNVTAKPTNSPEEIRVLLIKQLTHPVRWVESVQNMILLSGSEFYEVGPGKVLTGLLRRIDRSCSCTPVGKAEDLERLKEKQAV